MKKLFAIIILACISIACEDSPEPRIPWVLVDLTIDLNFEDKDLIAFPSTKIFMKEPGSPASDRYGYGGVLVYNAGDKFYAYDLACPVEVDRDVKIEPYLSVQAKCPKCGAVYNLNSGGFPVSGSQYPLEEYTVIPNGYNRYKIVN